MYKLIYDYCEPDGTMHRGLEETFDTWEKAKAARDVLLKGDYCNFTIVPLGDE